MRRIAGYYNWNPSYDIKDVLLEWSQNGNKIYNDTMPAYYSPRELWPFREYTWTREKSRSGFAIVDGRPVELPGAQKWDTIKKNLLQKGWDPSEPLYLQVGKNGEAKVAEGNHRLAMARELSLNNIPVVFQFYQNVSKYAKQNGDFIPEINKMFQTPGYDISRLKELFSYGGIQEQELIKKLLTQKLKKCSDLYSFASVFCDQLILCSNSSHKFELKKWMEKFGEGWNLEEHTQYLIVPDQNKPLFLSQHELENSRYDSSNSDIRVLYPKTLTSPGGITISVPDDEVNICIITFNNKSLPLNRVSNTEFKYVETK